MGAGHEQVENELRSAARAGQFCDLSGRPEHERVLRPELIYELCTTGTEAHARGLRIRSARIVERLEFDHARLVVPLVLDRCELRKGLTLEYGATQVLALRHCEIAGDGLVLLGATIDGQLALNGARITGSDKDGNALFADSMRVTGGMRVDDGFAAAGSVRLLGATIGGQLILRDAQVGVDQNGNALVADRVRVANDLFLLERFIAAGSVRLLGATIGGQLALRGAQLGVDQNGNALVADGMRVASSVLLGDGFSAAGSVRFPGATIGSQLALSGAQLTGSLNGHSMRVANGGVIFDELSAAGEVQLTEARIDGPLLLEGASATEIVLDGMSCASIFPGSTGPRLTLRAARFGAVGGVDGWRDQLAWIRRQGWIDWSPDPYEQVIADYVRSGDEESARMIRIARAEDELRHLRETRRKGTWRYRFWRRAFGVLVGYGYKRYRAGWALVATIVVATLMFGWGEREGAMVPNDPPDVQGPCGEDYPCFNAVVYGIDVVLPIIDLGQDSAWRPIEVETTTPIAGLDPGGWWITARWVFIALGWILASVFVAAFTGLVQRS